MNLIKKIKGLFFRLEDWKSELGQSKNKRGIPLSKDQIKEMKEYFKLGFSGYEISNRTNISRKTVYKYVKQFRKEL